MTRYFETNGTSYESYDFNVKNVKWTILVVTGKFNYINCTKKSMGMMRSIGKDFKNWKTILNYYRNPTMKWEIMKIELGL